MFKTYVRSKIEYASPVWNPFYKSEINFMEKIQKKFTKRIPGMQELSYRDRLHHLKLDSLELCRLHADLCMTFKLIHKLVNCDYQQFFRIKNTVTRGHTLTLVVERVNSNLAKHSFAKRVVKPWNSLPQNVVLAQNYKIFRRRLAKIDLSRFLKRGDLEVRV